MSGSGGNSDDPFEWSNEQLIQELCGTSATTPRSWAAAPPKRWPDPAVLSAKLEEHDLDGQTLLCYEDYMGQGWFDSLCADLGVTKIPHKISLRMAIKTFQKLSSGYRIWKQSQDNNDPETVIPSSSPKKTTENTAEGGPAAAPPVQNGDSHASQAAHVAPEPAPLVVGTNKDIPNGITNGTTGATNEEAQPDAMQMDAPHSPPTMSLDQSKKRKRVVPTNLSSAPRPRKAKQGDSFGDPTTTVDAGPNGLWKKSKKGAYLGDWSLTRYALLQGADPLDPNNADDEDDHDNFGWSAPRPIPSGRRLQVHRTLQRYLRPGKPSFPQLGRTRTTSDADPLGVGAHTAEDDEVLPALGESDDEGYDTETWEAMELEAREREREKEKNSNGEPKKKGQFLPIETVDTIIADAICDIEKKWAEKKMDKRRRSENKLWNRARRDGSRKFLMNRARQEVGRLGQRIDKLVQEMRQVAWKNEKEIRLQSAILEQSIEVRQDMRWEARLYASPTAPAKVVVARPAPRRRLSSRAAQLKALENDEEILTSSSSEDEYDDDPRMQNFIVDDEARAYGHGHSHGLGDMVDFDDDGNATLSDDNMTMSADNDKRENGDGNDNDNEGRELRSSSASSGGVRSDEREILKRLEVHYDSKISRASNVFEDFRKLDAFQDPVGTFVNDFPLENMSAIVDKGTSYWEAAGDVTRLLCTIFWTADREQLSRLVDYCTATTDVDVVWKNFCAPVLENEHDTGVPRDGPEDDATAFTRYFHIFVTCRDFPFRNFDPKDEAISIDIEKNQRQLGKFCVKLRTLAPYFIEITTKPTTPPTAPAPATAAVEVVDIDSDEEDDDELDLYDVRPVVRRHVFEDDTDDDDDDVMFSHSQKRRRHIRKDQGAQDLRDKDKARHQEQENRRKALYESLAQSGTLSQDQTRLIINTAKDAHHGIVYVNNWIGRNIRDHQIEGVRFMWNQIVQPPGSRQGCLLAHTMGLGKTMQVITLLVAIAEAAKSPDESIHGQIPHDLWQSKTLILCPSGLVENWLDELLAWAPSDTLGRAYSVMANMDSIERMETIRAWSTKGGVLVMGYPMFIKVVKDFGEDATDLLEKSPNIVIADEAHTLKNSSSRIHQVTRNFRTSARIAMTGSPLANSVDEYHSMINWVAPNYLAARDEFRATYSNPIREGFYRDSTRPQKRHAVKMLKVLKDTVAPKIHRATIASLQGVLPEKREFILFLPLTSLQMRVYKTFVEQMRISEIMPGINSTVQLWNTLLNLTLLLAHPKIFKKRLEEMKGQTGPRSGTLPDKMIAALSAAVNSDSIDSATHSSKIMVLLGILDEAKCAGEKVLVFSQSMLVLDHLQSLFRRQKRRFQRLDGGTMVNKRQAQVKDFNVSADEVYLISTTAGGVGLNIQGANRVVILDFKWNPINEQQAIGRAYRIGQTRRVFVYWLIMDGTFETVLHDQAVFKTQLASRVVDKKNPTAWADQVRNYTKDPEMPPTQYETIADQKGKDVVLDALVRPGAPTNGRILRIISTDTFEQEEPEESLTNEELLETATMVNMNKMRLRSGAVMGSAVAAGLEAGFQVVGAPGMPQPAEAATALRLERTQVDGVGFPPKSSSAPIASVIPPVTLAASRAMDNVATMGRAEPQPTVVPPSLVLASQTRPQLRLPQPPVQVQTQSHDPMYAYDSFITQPPDLPMQIRSQNAADIGVNFGSSQLSKPTQPTQPKRLSPRLPPPPTITVPSNGHRIDNGDSWFYDPIPGPAEAPASAPASEPKPRAIPAQALIPAPEAAPAPRPLPLAASADDLIATLQGALINDTMPKQQCVYTAQKAESVARRAVEDMLVFFKDSGLPAKAHWGRLNLLAHTAPGFSEAVIYGMLNPQLLASFNAMEERRMVECVAAIMAEIDSRPSEYNDQTTPNACTLLGNQKTVIRILERKLDDRSWTTPQKAMGNILVSKRLAAAAVLLHTQEQQTSLLTRCAARAFRDPVFANAFVSPNFDYDGWAEMTLTQEDYFVRRLHIQHMTEHLQEYHEGHLRVVYTPGDNSPLPPRTTAAQQNPPAGIAKPEPMDDTSSATMINSIPNRPHSIAGNTGGRASFGESFSGKAAVTPPSRPLGHVVHAYGQGETRSEAGATPVRAKDPDHVKHHLKRSQSRNHETLDRSPMSLGRSDGASPAARDGGVRPRVSSSGAGSRDLVAMREVMERRKRKTAAQSATTPQPQAQQSPQVQQIQEPRRQSPNNMPAEWQQVARGTMPQVAASQLHTPSPPILQQPFQQPVNSFVPETPAAATTSSFHRGHPRIDPASQLQRVHHGQQATPQAQQAKSRSQIERELLEADRRQQSAKKDKVGGGGSNRPKILPPPTPRRGSGPQAGDNARNPFVVD